MVGTGDNHQFRFRCTFFLCLTIHSGQMILWNCAWSFGSLALTRDECVLFKVPATDKRLYRYSDLTTQDILKEILSRVKELHIAYTDIYSMEIKGEDQIINGTARQQKQHYKNI